MRIGEVKIQKIRENGNRECNLELFPNRTKMAVYSLKEYGFKVLGVYNFQYMERFLFEYNSKKMQIDLYYNKEGFYTYLVPYAEDEETKRKIEEWANNLMSQKICN